MQKRKRNRKARNKTLIAKRTLLAKRKKLKHKTPPPITKKVKF